MLIVVVLLATVAMRVAIVTVVVYLLLPQGRFCPHCGGEMTAIRNRFFDRVAPLVRGVWVGRHRAPRPRGVTAPRRAAAPHSFVISRAARS